MSRFEILRVPGEAFAHGVPDHLIAECLQRIALRRLPRAFDELHDADALAATEHSKSKAERRRRFALAGPGVDDEQALLDFLVGDLGVLHGLALRHLGAMAFGLGFIDGLAHGCPFTNNGRPGDQRTTRSARAAIR